MTAEKTVYTYEDWKNTPVGESVPFLNAMHSGEQFECDREMFYYWLEVLPPVWMQKTIEIQGRKQYTNFGFAEGMELVTAFWGKEGRYFGQRTDIMNPYG